jgi:hypothetical protein
MSCSQPVVAMPSQSAKPGVHAATPHTEAAHAGVALGRRQIAPHAPQWFGSDPSNDSQPLVGMPSQSPRPALQVEAHCPITQLAAASVRAGHPAPQAPQCAALDASSTSQPLLGSLSQSPKPALHATRHRPPSQRPTALAPATQAIPQAPQCWLFDASSASHPVAGSLSQSA